MPILLESAREYKLFGKAISLCFVSYSDLRSYVHCKQVLSITKKAAALVCLCFSSFFNINKHILKAKLRLPNSLVVCMLHSLGQWKFSSYLLAVLPVQFVIHLSQSLGYLSSCISYLATQRSKQYAPSKFK